MSSPTIVLIGLALAVTLLAFEVIGGSSHGLRARWNRRMAARQRILAEDALKHLHASHWEGHEATLDSLAGSLCRSQRAVLKLVTYLETLGWVKSVGDGLRLTPKGELAALPIIRAHRLWERYLADEARMALSDVHRVAHHREHGSSEEAVHALEASLGFPSTDPHGDPIPAADGQMAREATQSITAWPLDTPARIVHLEDEPAPLFAQLAALGLHPGQTVRVIEANPQRITISDGVESYVLAPPVAANIFVAPAATLEAPPHVRSLATLAPGEGAVVHGLDEPLRGFTRRRLLDLGLTPGARIVAEATAVFGDPVAYWVRGSLVALRREQAQHVLIKAEAHEEAGQ